MTAEEENTLSGRFHLENGNIKVPESKICSCSKSLNPKCFYGFLKVTKLCLLLICVLLRQE